MADLERKHRIYQYKTGGLADFTGPAWLDGTKAHPELVLNQTDTQNFIALKDILSDIMNKDFDSSKNKDKGNNYYDIEISDNGCGIKDEEKKKIFMPNFTTKSSGMGVGLSIVYDILETLESTISFESEVGKGTIFRINIKK